MIPGITAFLVAAIPGAVASTDDSAAVAEHLTRLERKFAEATLSGDYKSIEDLLAPEFTGVDPNGREFTRAEVLGSLQSQNRKVDFLRHENIRVKVYGECAVVFAVTVMGWRNGDQTDTGRFPYMRVWVKRQRKWLAVATQSCGTGK